MFSIVYICNYESFYVPIYSQDSTKCRYYVRNPIENDRRTFHFISYSIWLTWKHDAAM